MTGRITDTCAEFKRVIWYFIMPDGVSGKMAMDGICGRALAGLKAKVMPSLNGETKMWKKEGWCLQNKDE